MLNGNGALDTSTHRLFDRVRDELATRPLRDPRRRDRRPRAPRQPLQQRATPPRPALYRRLRRDPRPGRGRAGAVNLVAEPPTDEQPRPRPPRGAACGAGRTLRRARRGRTPPRARSPTAPRCRSGRRPRPLPAAQRAGTSEPGTGATMTATDKLLDNAEQYALRVRPRRPAAAARVQGRGAGLHGRPATALGLAEGDVIRNAGGVGGAHVNDDEFADRGVGGERPDWRAHAFADLEQDLREGLDRIRSSPFGAPQGSDPRVRLRGRDRQAARGRLGRAQRSIEVSVIAVAALSRGRRRRSGRRPALRRAGRSRRRRAARRRRAGRRARRRCRRRGSCRRRRRRRACRRPRAARRRG